jgi:hypothetical protein
VNNKLTTKVEHSIGELFSELANETGTLVRQEIALAQAEMTQKVTRAGKNAALLGAGIAVGYGAFIVLLACLVAALSYLMPVWLAALVVSLIVGAVSFFMINSTLTALKQSDLAPRETVDTLKEDAQWLKRQMT